MNYVVSCVMAFYTQIILYFSYFYLKKTVTEKILKCYNNFTRTQNIHRCANVYIRTYIKYILKLKCFI